MELDGSEREFHVEVGLLYWRPVRQYLRLSQFRDPRIQWFESTGWLDRLFIVRGPSREVGNIELTMLQWVRRIVKP